MKRTKVRMKTAMSASKSLEKMIAKKRQLSPVAIKPVSDACLLFFRSLVLLAELTSLTTKSSNFFPEARTCHRNMPPILYRREINKNDKKKFFNYFRFIIFRRQKPATTN